MVHSQPASGVLQFLSGGARYAFDNGQQRLVDRRGNIALYRVVICLGNRPVTGQTEAEAANELMRLAREIARHNRLYHAEDDPEITDAEYDALIRRNTELEEAFPHLVREDSPNRVVGHEVAASPLAKVTHAQRMMSLDNAFAADEVADFVGRVRRFLSLAEDEPVAFTAEDKIDGLSCSLRYEHGQLVLAATRGSRQGSGDGRAREPQQVGRQWLRLAPRSGTK